MALAVTLLAGSAQADAIKIWGKQLGSANFDYANEIARGPADAVAVVGSTDGPLAGTPKGGSDGFLALYRGNGTLAWKRQFGSTGNELLNGVAVDPAGYVLFAGQTDGNYRGTNKGARDIILGKYSPAGGLVFKRQIGTSSDEEGRAVAAHSDGSFVVVGLTYGDLVVPNIGRADAVVVKYSSTGGRLWTRQLGSTNFDSANAVVIDALGNVFVAGRTDGALAGPPQGTDIFLAKYSLTGTLLWTRQYGSTAGGEWAQSIALDSVGDVVLVGTTGSSLGGPQKGGGDAFVMKCDPDGNQKWIQQFGSNTTDRGWGVAIDSADNIIVSGENGGYIGPVFYGGESDALLAKYSSAGDLLWLYTFGSSGDDKAYGVTTIASDDIVVAGSTTAKLMGTYKGYADAFVARYADQP